METTDYLRADGMLACFSIEIHDMNLIVIIFSKCSQSHTINGKDAASYFLKGAMANVDSS